jgi:hypothetical protein
MSRGRSNQAAWLEDLQPMDEANRRSVAPVRALGVDLGLSWGSTGTALLEFVSKPEPRWLSCTTNVVQWPKSAISASAIAEAIHQHVIAHRVAAVSIDGPQGWRDPDRQDQGSIHCRLCEQRTRTPGKTGPFGVVLPATWTRWVTFSIEVFDALLQKPGVHLVNDATVARLNACAAGEYHLMECFPTSTWRTAGLDPLPGHRNAPPSVVEQHAHDLQKRLLLPGGAVTDHHDHLQAVVSALPAAGLLGGPCEPIARGLPSRMHRCVDAGGPPFHRVEGLIWDARTQTTGGAVTDRDERQCRPDSVLRRGVALFIRLVEEARLGVPTGVGYAQFIALVHGKRSFREVAGRTYKPSDSRDVVALASRVTEAAGGRREIRRGDVAIHVGMDTFIWSQSSPHDRPVAAWSNPLHKPPYSREEWLQIFADGQRRLLLSGDRLL